MDEDRYLDSDDQDDVDDDFDTKTSEDPAPGDDWCCANKCTALFDEQFVSRLKSDMSALSPSEKRIFLFAMISIDSRKKSCKGNAKWSKYFEYTVKECGISRIVCKKAFISLHDTTSMAVRTLCKKMKAGLLIPTDHRGKHKKQVTISDDMKELINTHFVNIMRSPAIFKCVKEKLGKPNVYQLWIDFTKNHGHIAHSTYTKYLSLILTPDVLADFMCANEAKLILEQLNFMKKRSVLSKNV